MKMLVCRGGVHPRHPLDPLMGWVGKGARAMLGWKRVHSRNDSWWCQEIKSVWRISKVLPCYQNIVERQYSRFRVPLEISCLLCLSFRSINRYQNTNIKEIGGSYTAKTTSISLWTNVTCTNFTPWWDGTTYSLTMFCTNVSVSCWQSSSHWYIAGSFTTVTDPGIWQVRGAKETDRALLGY